MSTWSQTCGPKQGKQLSNLNEVLKANKCLGEVYSWKKSMKTDVKMKVMFDSVF